MASGSSTIQPGTKLTPPKTGLVYDERMLEHKSLWEDHPERPERLTAIVKRCEELNLVSRCQRVTPRLATEYELLTKHTREHVDKLRSLCEQNAGATENNYGALEAFAKKYGGHSYYHPSTYQAALLSAGSTIELCTAVAEGRGGLRNGMALVRPPGHHAMKAEYCGYCYFNNVALAAARLLETGTVKRVLIVDWDVHHGQATQQMFYDDPRVLYFSMHRFEHGAAWPNLRESDWNWIGSGAGLGYNCNVPLNKIRMGDAEYLAVWHQILLPMAYQFQPDIVLVSGGYDAALNDPLGEMCVTPQCYAHLLWPLMGLAGGRVVVVLEGGYCLDALAEGAALTLRALLGDACPPLTALADSLIPELVETVYNVSSMLGEFWTLGLNTGSSPRAEEVHLPQLKFVGPPEAAVKEDVEQPARDPHAVHLHHIWSIFGEDLAELIGGTELPSASLPLGLLHSMENKDAARWASAKGRNRVLTMEVATHFGAGPGDPYSDWKTRLLELVRRVGGQNRSSRTGLALLPSSEYTGARMTEIRDAIFRTGLGSLCKMKRILHLELTTGASTKPPGTWSVHVEEVPPPPHARAGDTENRQLMMIKFGMPGPATGVGGATTLGALLVFVSRILPIAYGFDPDVVLLVVEHGHGVGGNGKPLSLIAHVVHLLSALAGGKLLLLLTFSPESPSTDERGPLQVLGTVMLGDGPPSFPSSGTGPLTKGAVASSSWNSGLGPGAKVGPVGEHTRMLKPFQERRISAAATCNVPRGKYAMAE